jgi:4-hydroxy-2-oxoheptanedioate aldolase
MSERIDEILRNYVQEKLARDEVVASMTVRLVRSVEIASIARSAGFDTLYIDVEHSSFSFETTSQICIAALGAGITPFVRVPTIRPEHVSRALDGGALGVIAPHVCSAEDARAVVRAAKFAPLGERSAASGLPHLQYRSFPAAEVNRALNAASMVVVQCESDEGLRNLEEIVAVDGVDMVLIGTNDLLQDWGLTGQYEHARVREAYAHAIAACREHGKHVGVGGLATRPALAAEFVRMGARYVSTGNDLGFLLAACAEKAKQVREMAVR